jgi:hypothetical protein
VKNAYTAAQAYFSDWPAASVDVAKLQGAGYSQSSNVNLTVVQPTMAALQLTAVHASGKATYSIDSTGKITQ